MIQTNVEKKYQFLCMFLFLSSLSFFSCIVSLVVFKKRPLALILDISFSGNIPVRNNSTEDNNSSRVTIKMRIIVMCGNARACAQDQFEC